MNEMGIFRQLPTDANLSDTGRGRHRQFLRRPQRIEEQVPAFGRDATTIPVFHEFAKLSGIVPCMPQKYNNDHITLLGGFPAMSIRKIGGLPLRTSM